MAEGGLQWRAVRAVLQLPFVVTVLVPGALVLLGGTRNWGWAQGALAWLVPLVGVAVAAAGVTLMVVTIRLFVTDGDGTLAPWDPTTELVVVGPYRHVRNPMITGVFCVLLGEALVLQSTGILVWFAAFVTANAIYMPLSEEPGLRERFGASYDKYCRNVPRWIPRLRPWTPDA